MTPTSRSKAAAPAAALVLLAWGAGACRAPSGDGSEGASQPSDAALAPVHDDDVDWLDEEDVVDGPYLYERNCSGCHGVTGAGDGATARELGVHPRDFVEGGFSFGNTPDSLFRTVSSGIPGRSVMPSFGGILDDEEIWMIVEHVRTLMPEAPEEDTAASVMSVGTSAVIARGKLPPIDEGCSELPRGLLLGTPSGLSFEFDAEDVRLVGVRMGAFCDREDWRGRGGGYLKPLGQPIYVCDQEPGRADFEELVGSERVPLTTRLRSSWSEGERAGLQYDLVAPDGTRVARVRDVCAFAPLTAGGSFARLLELEALDRPVRIVARLAGDRRSVFAGQPGMHVDDPSGLGVVELEAPYWVVGERSAHTPEEPPDSECVRLELAANARRVADRNAVRVLLSARPGSPSHARATVVQVPDADPERLAALAEEIAR